MATRSRDQYVFGTHVAPAADPRPRGSTSDTVARTVTAMREVPPDGELSTLCSRVADALPPTARAAVLLVAPSGSPAATDRLSTAAVATTSPSTTAVLRIEWLLREGPVRTSLASGQTTVSSRLGADDRWPRFARAVSAHGAVSAAAVPILLESGVPGGVLAAYSPDVGAFDPRDVRVLTAFSQVVADVVVREPLAAPAPDAEDVETTRLVNQAVGVLIARHCDEEQALRRLTKISESTGQSLAAAARMIVLEAQVAARLRFVARAPRPQA